MACIERVSGSPLAHPPLAGERPARRPLLRGVLGFLLNVGYWGLNPAMDEFGGRGRLVL